MSNGVILFAFNTEKHNYCQMAVATAKRINHFLKLPVTIVTDNTLIDYKNNLVFVPANTDNNRDGDIWKNKNRFNAFEYSPYDKTIVLDVDYLINSDKLSLLFELPTDFCCHKNTTVLMEPSIGQEKLSQHSFPINWATVIYFTKTERSKQIFQCMEMIQNNYQHYANIYNFFNEMYRNDYALTIALRIVNGHLENKKDIIPWNLVHTRDLRIMPLKTNKFNTEFQLIRDYSAHGKNKSEYITISDLDFHMINKKLFMELA